VQPELLGVGVILGAAGLGFTVINLTEAAQMEGQHWIMLLVVLVAGYVLGRLMPQVGQMVGLP
jgi:flagellar biogenesis protein FliO